MDSETEKTVQQQHEGLMAPFQDDELEWKPQMIGKGAKGVWAILVPYVSSRAIMKRLDSVFGPGGWNTRFRETATASEQGYLCELMVQWADRSVTTREDGAPATHIEPIKGGVSSALKRVAVQYGIGQYLYDLPQFWARDIKEGFPPNEPGVVNLRSESKDIQCWCYAPKLNGASSVVGELRVETKSASGSATKTPPQKTSSPTGEKKHREMKSNFGSTDRPSYCKFCGTQHVIKGDTLICAPHPVNGGDEIWGAKTCWEALSKDKATDTKQPTSIPDHDDDMPFGNEEYPMPGDEDAPF